MVLDDLLDFSLDLWRHVTSRDFLEESALGSSQVCTELGFPLCDLVDGDGVELGFTC